MQRHDDPQVCGHSRTVRGGSRLSGEDACAAMDLNLNGEIIPADTVRKALIAALDGAFAAII